MQQYRMKAVINGKTWVYQGSEIELRRIMNAILRQFPHATFSPLIRVGILGRFS